VERLWVVQPHRRARCERATGDATLDVDPDATPDVRDAATQEEIEARKTRTPAEFRERGAEVYLPVNGIVAADAGEPVAAE
jgi:hypothetical protein